MRGKEEQHQQQRVITPHRAYRVLDRKKWKIIRDIIILFIILIVFVIYAERVVDFVNETAYSILSKFYSSISISSHGFGFWEFKHLSSYGKYPPEKFSLIVLISSVILSVLFFKLNVLKNVALFLSFVSVLIAVSAAYFLLFMESFPYTLESFVQIYIDIVFAAWIAAGVVLLLSFAPFPISIVYKILFFLLFLVVVVFQGIAKYVFVVAVLKELSYLFAPILFFIFGPLLDMVYAVFVFSLFVSFTTCDVDNLKIWRWVGW